MKRIISLALILMMMLSIAAVSSSAAGVYLNADFKSMTEEQFYAQFMVGEFHVDDVEGVLYGYSEAKALQSMYSDPEGIFDNTLNTWLTYDAAITFSMADDELSEVERTVNIAYCNDNLRAKGLAEAREFVTFSYNIEKQELVASVNDGPTYNEERILAGPVSMELDTEGDTFYTMGMSVEKNHIRFFLDNQLIFDIDGTSMYVGDSINSPFIFWNDGNYIRVSNIAIASETFLYPGTNPEPNPNVTTTQPADTTTSISVVVNTDDSGNVVTDAEGNKVTDTVIITNAPADTNTGAVQGGNSTNTGDTAFIVVAAMVAALGCAIIIRKVNA